jgi:DNA-binding CsgD family transcriptional regulator
MYEQHGYNEEALRAHAVRVDQTQARQIDLSQVWRELSCGTSRVKDSFHSPERCYLVLEAHTDTSEKVLRAQAGKIKILESILLEAAQKNVAMELGLSPSTVAGALKQCLEQLGLPCTTSRISPLVVAAAYAAQADSSRYWGRVSEVTGADFSYRVVSVARPESEVARLLTRAQYEVVRLLIEGKSHVEMAVLRQRSTRTIANQLGAAFRKLGVSGRSELIRRLIAQPNEHSLRDKAPKRLAAWAEQAPFTVRRYRPRARRAAVPASL